MAEDAAPVPEPVRAAGAVPWRFGDDDRIEVLLVHRPRYDDWTFPKGKRDEGESDEECARREVFEETGVRGDLGRELPACEYVDNRGRDKVVRYWEMALSGDARRAVDAFVPNDEVDVLRWAPVPEALDRLSYGRDRRLLVHFVALSLT